MATSTIDTIPTLVLDREAGKTSASVQDQVEAFLNLNLDAIRKVGVCKIPISLETLEDLALTVEAQFAFKDDLPFDPATYWGYQNREKCQQEIICRREDEVTDPVYQLMMDVADGALRLFGSLDSRKSPVFWRYDPQNKPDLETGFGIHEDFSLMGITFQCAPGLFWVPEDDVEIDLWAGTPHILLTFGQPSAEHGFTPFKHGVKRIAGNPRLAGGVFIDPVDETGDDGVAQKMDEYDRNAETE
jgi:hypothetical protein